jgi:hypothetical protein
MKWIVEYINGTSISEDEINFAFIEKQNIKQIYFIDGSDIYGLNAVNKKFFINNIEYDFKIIKSPDKFIQYKTAQTIVNHNLSEILSWNLGFEIYTNNMIEKYVMSIAKNKEVFFIATRQDLKSQNIDERKIRLQ